MYPNHALKTVVNVIPHNFPSLLSSISYSYDFPGLGLSSGVLVQILVSDQVQEVLTLLLCCSVLPAAWFWLCRVSRSRLHRSWKRDTKKGDDEKNPQRGCYVMERLIGDYFEEGKKRGGETESYSYSKWNRGGVREEGAVNSKREGVQASERKQKFLTAAQRQIVWFKLCAMDVSGKLSRHSQPIGSSDWISGKVGRKCNVKQDGTFPWQQNLTVAINYLAGTIQEGGVCQRQKKADPALVEHFKKQKHTNLPSSFL